MTPRLLVSVRNRDEAVEAILGGAEIVDVKEPTRGSLGRPDLKAAGEAIAVARRAQKQTSVALGELYEPDDHVTPPSDASERLQDLYVDYAKVGLAGAAGDQDWKRSLRRFWRDRPPGTTIVLVAYVDAALAEAPPVEEVVRAAAAVDAGVLLLDTFDKRAGRLLDWISHETLQHLRQETETAGLQLGLAGSLRIDELTALRTLAPDIVGLRGAVCGDDRLAPVDRTLVQRARQALATSRRRRSSGKADA